VVNRYIGDRAIGYQVLAVMMMKVGAEISEEVKTKMIDEAYNDEWAQEDNERKLKIENLIECLEKYNGKPLAITSKGLFQVINEIINNK
jgi:hypothetical protein